MIAIDETAYGEPTEDATPRCVHLAPTTADADPGWPARTVYVNGMYGFLSALTGETRPQLPRRRLGEAKPAGGDLD